MDRKEFIKACSLGCLGMVGLNALQGCKSTKVSNAAIEGSYLVVPLSDFEEISNNRVTYKEMVIVQNSSLQYPVLVNRQSENYTAVLMRCTHQGTELRLFGNILQCSAHGSEFDKKGSVLSGPADKALRVLPVLIKENNLLISLK